MQPPKDRFASQIQAVFGLTDAEAYAIANAVFDMQAYHPDTIMETAIRMVNECNLEWEKQRFASPAL